MTILLIILGIFLALSVIGFVIETLFWLGVAAAIVFVVVAAVGAIKGKSSNRSLR